MKLLIYFLILANAIFLFLNWDVISSVATGKTTSQVLVGETLVLKGDKQIPAPQTSQTPPPTATNQVTNIISTVISFLSQIGKVIKDIFSDVPQELPAGEAPPPPKPEAPKSTKCYQLSGYPTSKAALTDIDILNTYGVKSKMRDRRTTEKDSARYRILVKVRANLDTAKELSDLLSGSGVPNRIKEDAPLGFLLVTGFYNSRSQADRVHSKVKKLGFSAKLESSPGSSKVTNTKGRSYDLLIDQKAVVEWELSRRNIISLLNPQVKVQTLPRC